LESDVIDFVGQVNGLLDYEAVFGNAVTIPDIEVLRHRLVAKASDPTPAPVATKTPTPALSSSQIQEQFDKGQLTKEEALKLLKELLEFAKECTKLLESQNLSYACQRYVEEHYPDATPTLEATPTPEPINLSGKGQQASQKFHLNQGLAIFKITHDGGGFFNIDLLDNQGNYIAGLAFEIGESFDGSKAVGIDESGTYILDIKADGDWTVRIEQ